MLCNLSYNKCFSLIPNIIFLKESIMNNIIPKYYDETGYKPGDKFEHNTRYKTTNES